MTMPNTRSLQGAYRTLERKLSLLVKKTGKVQTYPRILCNAFSFNETTVSSATDESRKCNALAAYLHKIHREQMEVTESHVTFPCVALTAIKLCMMAPGVGYVGDLFAEESKESWKLRCSEWEGKCIAYTENYAKNRVEDNRGADICTSVMKNMGEEAPLSSCRSLPPTTPLFPSYQRNPNTPTSARVRLGLGWSNSSLAKYVTYPFCFSFVNISTVVCNVAVEPHLPPFGQ